MELVSLFCGPGGLDEGFRQAGFKTMLAYDQEEHCVNTHKHNHASKQEGRQGKALKEDLSDIETQQVRFHWKEVSTNAPTGLVGGPPCQSFSHSNVFKKDDDPRDELVAHYARILTAWQEGLHFFVFENVTALFSDKHIEKYNEFKNLADEAGFEVHEETLNAKDFGVPQHRKRVFVVGISREHYPNHDFEFPEGTCEQIRTVGDVLREMPEPTHYQHGLDPEDIRTHPNHWCSRPISEKFSNGSITPGETTKSRSFRALAWDQPSYTVAYGNREVHVHPDCERRLSIYEAMKLQGFDRDYELLGNMGQQVTMISDAVPPPVAEAIAQALLDQLDLPELEA